MATLTSTDYQAEVLLEVGDQITTAYPSGILASNIARIWQMEQSYSATPNLQYLRVKRRCFEVLRGIAWKEYNTVEDGATRQRQQKFANLTQRLKEVDDEILRESGDQGIWDEDLPVGVIGSIDPANPTALPNLYPDPYDPRYHGELVRGVFTWTLPAMPWIAI